MTAGTQVIGLYLIGAARNYSWSNGSARLFMNGMTNCIRKKKKKKCAFTCSTRPCQWCSILTPELKRVCRSVFPAYTARKIIFFLVPPLLSPSFWQEEWC